VIRDILCPHHPFDKFASAHATIACPLTRPGEGVYIRKSEIVGTSTLRASRVEGREGEEEEGEEEEEDKCVLLVTDPRGDDDEGSGI